MTNSLAPLNSAKLIQNTNVQFAARCRGFNVPATNDSFQVAEDPRRSRRMKVQTEDLFGMIPFLQQRPVCGGPDARNMIITTRRDALSIGTDHDGSSPAIMSSFVLPDRCRSFIGVFSVNNLPHEFAETMRSVVGMKNRH